MKTLYLECSMGAAGDMLSAALIDLLEEKEQIEIVEKLNQLGLHDVVVNCTKDSKCGIDGKHVTVKIHGEEEHSHDYHEHGHHHEEQEHHEHEHGHHHEDHEHSHEHEHSHHHEEQEHHDHDHGHHHHEDHDHDHNHHEDHEHHGHEHGHHHHSSLHDIEHIIDKLPVSDKVKNDAYQVYTLIAKAEGHVHGKEMTEIHFHEVGTLDAVVDVVTVCMLMEKLAPERVIISPVHVGSGHVKCAHGILPVPAPATAHILTGIPTYSGSIKGELCTPTGAALLKYFADSFGSMPVMAVSKIGYGMGTKDFEIANCVRAMVGEEISKKEDSVVELVCNVDDMTGEAIGYALDIFMEQGALDVYAVASTTKKSRPGHLLTVLCKENKVEDMVALIMRHTTTIGIRKRECERYILERHEEIVQTVFGPVRKKISEGYGVVREKYEYDDLKRIATENGFSLETVIAKISE